MEKNLTGFEKKSQKFHKICQFFYKNLKDLTREKQLTYLHINHCAKKYTSSTFYTKENKS